MTGNVRTRAAGKPAANAARLPTAAWRARFARKLLPWYDGARRDLPWRRTRDPYAIWISEIMLQQTQVATVIDYFNRFLAAFPDVRSLAAADEQSVLRQWEGLGYYRRARNMHRAAALLVAEHACQFPRELDTIRALPGIGRYTAGAIRSIAFDLPAPILEANTVRLLSRLVGFTGDTSSTAGQKLLWQVAEDLLPAQQCGAFNSALMELGSQICTPQSPDCAHCPVKSLCVAYEQGAQDSIPRLRAKPAIEQIREAVVAISHRGKWLLRQYKPNERWAGLWDFVRFPLAAKGASPEREIRRHVQSVSQIALDKLQYVTTLKHGVTRYRITLDCYRASAELPRARPPAGAWRWVKSDALDAYPLSTTGRKFARLLVAKADSPRQRKGLL